MLMNIVGKYPTYIMI